MISNLLLLGYPSSVQDFFLTKDCSHRRLLQPREESTRRLLSQDLQNRILFVVEQRQEIDYTREMTRMSVSLDSVLLVVSHIRLSLHSVDRRVILYFCPSVKGAFLLYSSLAHEETDRVTQVNETET